jgi:Helix-loop-helix DNA-binding domain
MATTTARPWEVSSSQSPRPSQPQALPSISALTNGLPDAGSSGLSSPVSTRERDSGAWSQPQSTRTSLRSAIGETTDEKGSSTYSTNTSSYPMSSATNSYYMSPNRMSNVSNHSGHGPTSHVSADYAVPPASAAPMSSPGYGNHGSLLHAMDAHHHHDPHRQSVTSQGSQASEGGFPPQESRRSSLGSQVNQGMTSLQINGAASPYQSVNHSSTSLAQNLSRERNIPGAGGLRAARSSAQLPTSPLSPGSTEQRPTTGYSRIAPPITHNPGSNVYNAADPVPGQAYAFPDAGDLEPGALPPKSSRQPYSDDGRRPSSHRRDSGHNSIGSNMTNDSRLPPGQHRLDEGPPGTPQHHHHSMQSHTTMSDVPEDEAMTPEENGAQPYSRTPALRVSHKMAERKRRSEMKDLFENLRSQIPSNQGSKSSKWEILTKASEYIKQLESVNHSAQQADKQLRIAMHDIDLTRRDNDKLRNENQQLLVELQRLNSSPGGAPPSMPPGGAVQQQGPPPPPPPPPQQQQPPPQQAPPQAYPSHYSVPAPPPPPSAMHDPARSLPPLGGSAAPPPPTIAANAGNSMQGVQYTHEQR